MIAKRAKRAIQTSVDRAAYVFGPHNLRHRSPKLWILMYHRVLPKSDPRYALEEPGMVVEPDTFAMQMDILQQYFTLIPLKEWITRRHNGQSLPSKSCAVTFDDGWADNHEYAFPILKEKGIPATLFAVSHMIGTRETFWPNKLSRLMNGPKEFLNTLPWLKPHLTAFKETSSTKEATAAVIQALKTHPDDRIHQWLEDANLSDPGEPDLMSWDQLRAMKASGLVDVGSHGCYHYRLNADLDPAVVRREIGASKQKLEAELGEIAPLFCYPNGDVCDLALQSVPEHYEAAVTTRRGINSAPKASTYELFRIAIHEDRCNTAMKFCSRLSNWY